jgi:hypothetical protein
VQESANKIVVKFDGHSTNLDFNTLKEILDAVATSTLSDFTELNMKSRDRN